MHWSVVSLFAKGYVFLFYLTILDQDMVAYLIFVIFSPHIKFWAKFFSTQNPVHCDKTNTRQNSINCKNICFLNKFEITINSVKDLAALCIRRREIENRAGAHAAVARARQRRRGALFAVAAGFAHETRHHSINAERHVRSILWRS